MPNVKDYFNKVAYKPKYFMGDRVRGLWNNIPFSGTIQLDTMTDIDAGPYILVYSDLPIKHNDCVHWYIKIKHTDILNKGNYGINRKTNT